MVSLKAIRAANKARSPSSPTAVFVGATSGIGLGAIEALLRYSSTPTIIIIGRSQTKFADTLARLQNLNAGAKLDFIEAQVSLLKEVDRACSIIKSQYDTIDFLWLSQGGLATATGSLSPEGLNEDLAISYYSRMLFMQRLIPLLNKSSDARVVSILSAGHEGTLQLSDLGLQHTANFGVFPTMKHFVTLTSLSMHELALENPNISFIHTSPGMVSTAVHDKWINSMSGPFAILGWIAKWTLVPFFHAMGFTPEQAGEIGYYELADAKFAASDGTNFFRLWEDAEILRPSATLEAYEKDGTRSKVWKHTIEVSEKVLSQ